MIAPSYQKNYTIESEPFKKNGKEYVTIKHNRTGNTRDARWYSDAEYAKAYPSEKCAFTVTAGKRHKVHDCLGFGGKDDSIIIYCGAHAEDRDYLPLKRSNARYHKLWGWYVPCNEIDPPLKDTDTIKIFLPWYLIGNEDGTLKDDKEVKKHIKNLRENIEYFRKEY